MRGSISNDGFSEAFTQEEEARRQAGLCTTGFWGAGWLGHWWVFLGICYKPFRTNSRAMRKSAQTEAIRP